MALTNRTAIESTGSPQPGHSRRNPYRCKKCQVPKKGHYCPYSTASKPADTQEVNQITLRFLITSLLKSGVDPFEIAVEFIKSMNIDLSITDVREIIKMAREENDRKFILAAVKENGIALEHASDSFKNDREIVLEAVKQNGYAFQYASDSLKNDRGIALTAVKQNGLVLQWVNNSFRNYYEIAVAAVTQSIEALQYVPDTLRDDVVELATASWGEGIESACTENKYDSDDECIVDLITEECLEDDVVVNKTRHPANAHCYNKSTYMNLQDKIDPFTRQEFDPLRLEVGNILVQRIRKLLSYAENSLEK